MTSGIPTTWVWTFEGASTPTSTDRDPMGIQYDVPGIYQVKLVASNEAGLDSLIKTEYITVSSDILPEASFSADQKIICTNGIVHFYDSTLYCPDTWQWTFDPVTVAYHDGTNANSQNPVVEFRQAGDYTVTLKVSNANGQDSLTKTAWIHSGGFSLPFLEDFESGTLDANSWTVLNPDNGYTWAVYNIAETGNTTVRMKFYGYFKMAERDQMISPYLNFSNLIDAYLSFDHAYAQRFSQKDSLIIYVASGCEDNWTRVFAGGPGNGSFETAPSTPYEFVPLSQEEWCGSGWGADCFTIDLTPWAGLNDIRIRFESYNNLGNDLYLDNILVSTTTGTPEVTQTTGKLAIYPNPGKGRFNIDGSGLTGHSTIQVLNMQGQMVHSETADLIQGNFHEVLDLSAIPAGIYFIRLVNESEVIIKKIVIQ
jgi:PKD repeat protein